MKKYHLTNEVIKEIANIESETLKLAKKIRKIKKSEGNPNLFASSHKIDFGELLHDPGTMILLSQNPEIIEKLFAILDFTIEITAAIIATSLPLEDKTTFSKTKDD
jgi:hypothetical protein